MPTVAELRKKASRLKIPGRSKFKTKADLEKAIADFQNKHVSTPRSRSRRSKKKKSRSRKSRRRKNIW